MDENSQGQSDGGCCCSPLMDETENIKKYKPISIIGIVVYSAMLIIDSFVFQSYYLFEYIFIIICLCLITFNRCFLLFQFYVIFSTILLFLNFIPRVGIAIQCLFDNSNLIAPFIVHFLMIIFYFVHFYLTFKAYKEMKYVFVNNNASPQLSSGFTSNFYQNNNYNNNTNDYNSNNYNSYNYNKNNNNNTSGGFKAFSGKGYTVGGS